MAQSGGRQPDALPLLADAGRADGLGESAGMMLGSTRAAAALELFRRRRRKNDFLSSKALAQQPRHDPDVRRVPQHSEPLGNVARLLGGRLVGLNLAARDSVPRQQAVQDLTLGEGRRLRGR